MAKTKAPTKTSKTEKSARKKAAKRAVKQVAQKSSAKGVKKPRKSDESAKKEKKPHKWRSGTKDLMAIKRLTGGKHALRMCTQRAPVERLFRELVADEVDGGKRMQAKAVDMLREAMEMATVRLFESCGEITGVAKKVTIDEACLRVAAKTVFGKNFFPGEGGDANPHTPKLSAVARNSVAAPKKKAVKKPAAKVASSSSDSASSSDEDGTHDDGAMRVEATVPLPPLMDIEGVQ
jgi:histone H3/H4